MERKPEHQDKIVRQPSSPKRNRRGSGQRLDQPVNLNPFKPQRAVYMQKGANDPQIALTVASQPNRRAPPIPILEPANPTKLRLFLR
jgi:hypothetical protein